jgi:hypothetical protein
MHPSAGRGAGVEWPFRVGAGDFAPAGGRFDTIMSERTT